MTMNLQHSCGITKSIHISVCAGCYIVRISYIGMGCFRSIALKIKTTRMFRTTAILIVGKTIGKLCNILQSTTDDFKVHNRYH